MQSLTASESSFLFFEKTVYGVSEFILKALDDEARQNVIPFHELFPALFFFHRHLSFFTIITNLKYFFNIFATFAFLF